MKQKTRANESRIVKKAREKLKKNLEVEQQKFTPEAFKKITQAIHVLITRHHPQPSFLKKRQFTIFDENSHTAQTKSKSIMKLQNMLQHQGVKGS